MSVPAPFAIGASARATASLYRHRQNILIGGGVVLQCETKARDGETDNVSEVFAAVAASEDFAEEIQVIDSNFDFVFKLGVLPDANFRAVTFLALRLERKARCLDGICRKSDSSDRRLHRGHLHCGATARLNGFSRSERPP